MTFVLSICSKEWANTFFRAMMSGGVIFYLQIFVFGKFSIIFWPVFSVKDV
jgi:hypothetical protein